MVEITHGKYLGPGLEVICVTSDDLLATTESHDYTNCREPRKGNLVLFRKKKNGLENKWATFATNEKQTIADFKAMNRKIEVKRPEGLF